MMNPDETRPASGPAGFKVAEVGMPPRPVDKYDAPSLAGERSGKRFHVMAKPSGSTCNLDCSYCFYLSKETLPNGPGTGRMSDAVLERFIQQYIAGVTGPEVVFSWQGGEPTLMGLDFFRKVVALEKKYAKPFQKIENDLQTNGTLINEEWCEFLKANRFLIGLSIDGPREMHDRYRVTKGGKPTFEKVFHTARLFQQFRIPFNTLTCVNRYNAKHPADVYRFLRSEVGSTYMQFIPIVEYQGFERLAPHQWNRPAAQGEPLTPSLSHPMGEGVQRTGEGSGPATQSSSIFKNHGQALPRDGDPEARPGHPHSIVTDWSVDPDDWGDFLCRVFDRWRSKDVGKILVNHFETLVSQHLGLGSQICIYGEFCGKGVAVEHNGDVYSCDHYVYPEYRLGNLKDAALDSQVFSRTQVQFGYAKNETLPQYCRRCPYLSDCWGECPKNRIIRTPDGEPGLNYLCRGFKKFFAHAIPEVERLCADLRKQPIQPRKRM